MSSPQGRGVARRARIARQFLQTHGHAESIIRRRLAPFWRAVTEDILAKLSRATSPHVYIDQIFIPSEWRPLFNAALIPGIQTAIYTGVSFEHEWVKSATGEATRQSIAKTAYHAAKLQPIQALNFSQDFREVFSGGGNSAPEAPFPWLITQRDSSADDFPDIGVQLTPELQESVKQFLESRRTGVWAKVGATTRTALQETIARGLTEGDSLKDLSKRIESTLAHYGDYEAKRIARTETTAAMNFGQQGERNDLGIEHKEWVSTIDNRTRGSKGKDRFDHLSPAGQTTRNGMPFVVSAESLMFPGDISLGASAGNVIHCRCCAVGAWPNETLTGGGGGGTGKPSGSTPPKMSPEDLISFNATQAMIADRASALTKNRVKQVVSLLRKHEQQLEKTRKEVLKFTEKSRKAKELVLHLDDSTVRLDERYRLAVASGDKAEAKRLKQEVAKAKKQLAKATDDVLRLEKNKSVIISKAVQTGTRPNIDWNFDSAVTDEMKAKARAAGDFIKQSASYESTGHLTINVQVIDPKIERASYDPRTQTLTMDPRDEIHTYVHELGHAVEQQGKYFAESKGFLHSRTGNDLPVILKKKYSAKHDPDEVTFEDEFWRAYLPARSKHQGAYTGKYYRTYTEILSMGIELLYLDGDGFAARDPEFFRFVIGVLQGVIRI